MVFIPPVFDSSDNLLAMGDNVAFELGDDVVVGDLKNVVFALLGRKLLAASIKTLEEGVEQDLLLFTSAAETLFDGVIVGKLALNGGHLLEPGSKRSLQGGDLILRRRGFFGEEHRLDLSVVFTTRGTIEFLEALTWLLKLFFESSQAVL